MKPFTIGEEKSMGSAISSCSQRLVPQSKTQLLVMLQERVVSPSVDISKDMIYISSNTNHVYCHPEVLDKAQKAWQAWQRNSQ